jgi:CheY-like chemotaxis protein
VNPMTLKLFVADDSVTIQKIVGLAFSGEDVVIQSVSSGDSALDEVRAFKPNIVLADVFMPGCNGYEVCAHIKDDPELKNTPVILLVGTFEPFDESEASRVRCDGYLTKPFDTSELIQMVYRLIKKESAVQNSPAPSHDPEDTRPRPVTLPANFVDRALVSSSAWTSFLGSGRVLDLFNPEVIAAAEKKTPVKMQPQVFAKAPAPNLPVASDAVLSDEVLDIIVDRVVRRMATDVVREVAWEVVPELSEVIIRRTLEERNKA